MRINAQIQNSTEWRAIKTMIDGDITTMRDTLETGGGDRERGGIAALRDLVRRVEIAPPDAAPSGYFSTGQKPT